MPLLYAATLFASAALLFAVQPLVGKLLLPLLGGVPAVWTACMAFFQAALLAGYLYAHALTSRLSPRRQATVHLTLLTAALALLVVAWLRTGTPLPRPAAGPPPGEDWPVGWLLGTLLALVGLPFVVLSATAPLLQRWFVATGHRSAGDPYFLYAASNLGSLLALLAYPLAVEPALTLAEQGRAWAVGLCLFAGLALACARLGASGGRQPPDDLPRQRPAEASGGVSPPLAGGSARPGVGRRVGWLLRAAVPSSLMLGVTAYLTTDLAPVPLLWVVPLALYLLSFVAAFARRPWLVSFAARVLPLPALLLAVAWLAGAAEPVWVLVPLHLGTFFLAALACHGRIARDRPPPERLTEFYLWLALGGVLGGLVNAVAAPLLLRHNGLVEYPAALVAACLLGMAAQPKRTVSGNPPPSLAFDWLGPLILASLTACLIWAVRRFDADRWLIDQVGAKDAGSLLGPIHTGLILGLPAVLAYTFVDRPLRFGLGLAALLLAGSLDPGPAGPALYVERNFFGVLRVTGNGSVHQLFHGNTLHGRQDDQLTDADGRHLPLVYYHPSGPIGQLFAKVINAGPPVPAVRGKRVALVGLGTGSLAYYARPEQEWTFYEIDPAVVRVASDPAYFSFLAECRCPPERRRVVVGDARLRLAGAANESFDVLVLDAFSSDAIPTHLLTREAMQLYRDKLADGGLIAVHVSNRYLDLPPVIARVAASFAPPLVGRYWDDLDASAPGKWRSQWLVLARRSEDLGEIGRRPGMWGPLPTRPEAPLWTDDFSNLISAFRRPAEE